MLSRIVIALLIVAPSTIRANGQAEVGIIHFSGNKTHTDQQLTGLMVSRPGSVFSQSQLADDLRAVEQKYQSEGYYFANIEIDSLRWSRDSISVDLYLGIVEDHKLEVGALRVDGAKAVSAEAIINKMETFPGKVFDQLTLERDIQEIISMYERSGYPFIQVQIRQISLTGDTTLPALIIEIGIDEGRKVVVQEIRVAGNKETNEDVIVRETRIAPNEVYNEDKVSKISQRLTRLNLFSSVGEPQLYLNPTGGGLLLTVQEGNTNMFDGILGYIPENGSDQKGFFAGMINISMRNLFGTARRLDVKWQREEQQSQEVGIEYSEPWIFGLPLNLRGRFFQRQQDSIYIRRTVEAHAVLMFADAVNASGNVSREDVIPSSSIGQGVVSASQTFYTGVELRFDTRDDLLSPTSGMNYGTGYQIGTKKSVENFVGSPSVSRSTLLQRVSLDAELYASLFVRQTLLVSFHGRQITGGNIELGDLYRFGGTNSLRGYRENQFLGSRVAWANVEYRFHLARHSFFYFFMDNGYYYLPADEAGSIPPSQAFKYGYGIGIRLETLLGNIGVSFALGEGDSFSQTKIHVGLINDF